MNELKQIPLCKDYYIDCNGNVFSNRTGALKKMNPYVGTNGKYLSIRLMDNDGNRKHYLIHRLVALLFINNSLNLPEVNHKDKNI